MATVSQLTKILSERLKEPLATVRQKLRQLQDDGLLPVASGRAVPHVDEHHIALAIFAVLAAPNVKEATRTAQLYADLRENGMVEISVAASLDDQVNRAARHLAGDYLATVIGLTYDQISNDASTVPTFRPYHANAIYEVCTNWPEFYASIPLFDDHGSPDGLCTTRFHETTPLAGHWQNDVKRSVSFSGIVLFYVVRDIIRADEATAKDVKSELRSIAEMAKNLPNTPDDIQAFNARKNEIIGALENVAASLAGDDDGTDDAA
ncbi:hypothetical protein [Aquisediminimonas sediminicola]|uniref:hypothetical protein n=1 Tax=Alteraquisediminimonas sediminicola TaxID=2676787 RepID=UPI001C8D8411|nr:hypothetical protein [Aquisediminimonas sediminicola]